MTKKYLGIASIATLLLSSNGMAASFDVKGEQISNECALTVMKKQVQVDRYLQIAAQYDTLKDGLKKKIDAANEKLLKNCSKEALAAKAAEKAKADKERKARNAALLAQQKKMFEYTWAGSYTCGGIKGTTRDHNINLEFTSVNTVKGNFALNKNSTWGLYRMSGKVKNQNTIEFTPTAWLDRPHSGWRTIHWTVTVTGKKMTGVGTVNTTNIQCELDAIAHPKQGEVY